VKLFLLSALLALPMLGCAAAGPVACQIIDTARDTCVLLKYLDKDGKPQEVRVPREELAGFAAAAAAKQAAAKPDAGAP